MKDVVLLKYTEVGVPNGSSEKLVELCLPSFLLPIRCSVGDLDGRNLFGQVFHGNVEGTLKISRQKVTKILTD